MVIGKYTVRVNALSDGYVKNDKDRHAYTEVIGNDFAESRDETKVDTEYQDIYDTCQF